MGALRFKPYGIGKISQLFRRVKIKSVEVVLLD